MNNKEDCCSEPNRKLSPLSLESRRKAQRNEREKRRASRISQQIYDLKDLLVSSGVMAENGTRMDVLAEATAYIRRLQQQLQQVERNRQRFLSNVNERPVTFAFALPIAAVPQHAATLPQPSIPSMTGSAPDSHSASVSPEERAAQQLADLGKTKPPQPSSDGSARTTATPSPSTVASAVDMQVISTDHAEAARNLAISASFAHQGEAIESDYRVVFQSSPFPMAIANLGGKFLDCNKLFRLAAGHTEEELTSMTFFNLTHQKDLPFAFDCLSKMITSPLVALGLAPGNVDKSSDVFTLRGKMPGSTNKSLRIKAVNNEQGTLRCLCITLIQSGEAG